MNRLLLFVLALAAAAHVPPGERLVDELAEVRERQYLTGERVGCQLRLATALADGAIEDARGVERRCRVLDRRS